MNRRSILKSLAAAPVLAAAPLAAQSTTPVENFKIEAVAPDISALPSQRFFTPAQFDALSRLGDLLVPAFGERPGSTGARAPLFIDFLLSKSPADRQKLYRDGLDTLNREKPFSKLPDEEAGRLLSPLKEVWTYQGPRDTFGRFLFAAKDDLLRATFNSREFIAAASQTQRGYNGLGYYWFPLE